MAEMMRAQVVEAPGKMVLKEIPVPEINDNEVLVKIKYCGICGSDWSIYTGKYAAEYLPFVAGHEMFGTVAKVGKNARELKVGDRVALDICLTCGTCYFCRNGDGLLCTTFKQLGIHTDGGFAEYVKAPWQNAYKVPDSVDDLTAAFIEPLTTTTQASKKMDPKLGSSCAVIGCGLGIIHAAFAKLRGCAPVILIGDHAARLKMALEIGACDYTINIKEVADTVAEVKKLTDGHGVDNVIEAVGTSGTYMEAFNMLRRGGKLEAFGICAPDDCAPLPPFEFVLGEKKVAGSCAGFGYDWGIAIRLLEYKRIDPKPMISMIVPLEELESALHELRSNDSLIKVLVDPTISQRVVL